MHEMSLCENILDIIEDNAKQQNFSKVNKIHLEIGKLSHAEPDAMVFCFDSVVKGTMAEGAKLVITRPEGKAKCLDCGNIVVVKELYDICSECDSARLDVIEGDEMKIKNMEVS